MHARLHTPSVQPRHAASQPSGAAGDSPQSAGASVVASISSVPTTVVLVVSSQLAASRAPHVPPPGVVVSAHEVWLLDVEDVSPVVVASRSSLAGGGGGAPTHLAERADPPPRVFALVCSPSSRPCRRIVHGRCESHHPQRRLPISRDILTTGQSSGGFWSSRSRSVQPRTQHGHRIRVHDQL